MAAGIWSFLGTESERHPAPHNREAGFARLDSGALNIAAHSRTTSPTMFVPRAPSSCLADCGGRQKWRQLVALDTIG